MRSLLRAQARHAAAVLVVIALGLGALPITFALVPGLTSVRLAMVPLPWIILGVVVYPLFVLVGWWGLRQAERVEVEFAEFTEAGLPRTGDDGRPADEG